MNKYQKILSIVALIVFSAITAEAKIGDTQDQVIRFAQKQEDIAAINTKWYGGDAAIDVVYTDGTTLTHVFGAVSGREIAQYLYAPKRLTDAQVKDIQRIYHTSWRGMGTQGGVYSWESQSNLYMAAIRYPNYDYLLIWDRNNIGEINTVETNALKAAKPAPAPSVAPQVQRQPQYLSTDPTAGLVAQPTPASSPAVDQAKKDCLIVATEAYARLKSTAYWVKMAGFIWTEKEKVIGGHAVVFTQPTATSDVFMYDAGGSYDLKTQSHDLDEIVAALNQLLQRTDIRVQAPKWLDDDSSRKEFASTKSNWQPIWYGPTPNSTEQTAAYQTGRLLGSLLAAVIGLGLYVWAIVVCFLKGKGGCAVFGILGFLIPIVSWVAVIGAIRIAKPDSWWARRYYGPEKLNIALRRFTPFYNQAQEAVPVIIDDPVERALERVRRKQAII